MKTFAESAPPTVTRFRHFKEPVGVRFWMNHLKCQRNTSAHDHGCLELAFIMQGKARHYTVNGVNEAAAGHIYIIPPGVWHGYTNCHDLEIYNCLISPSLLENELAWLAADDALRFLIPSGAGLTPKDVWQLKAKPALQRKVREALEALHQAYRGKPLSRARLLGALLMLLDLVSQAQGLRTDDIRRIAPPHSSVRQAMVLLQESPAQGWSLTTLARRLGINPSYLARLFQRDMGVAPMKYLTRLRARAAATLLLSTSLPVGAIAVQVGWPEPKQFARNFRRIYGLSGRAYRQKMISQFPREEHRETSSHAAIG